MELTTSFQSIARCPSTTYGGATDCYIELFGKYNSQSIENNTTNITIELRLHVGSGYIGNYQATYWGITGAVSNSGNLGSGNWRTMTIGSATGNVTHGNDGKKSISLSGYFNPTAWSQGGMEVSGSATLPTIPRESTISSVTTTNIGSNATITVDRKSSSFTHSIYYYFGDLSGTIVTKSSNTSISWTIPTSFYAKIPNSKTGTGTLQIYTYNGNTQIGSAQTKSYNVTTDESACKPTITRTAEDTNGTTLALTGNRYRFVKGYSTVLVNCSGTAKNSATMSSLKVYGTNVGTPGSTTQSGSRTLNNFNDTSISIVATDSRGYSTTNTLSSGTDYVLVDYIPLTFSGSVNRDTPTGNALYITFSGKYYAGSFGSASNSLTISWKWRRNDSGTWTSWSGGGTLTQGTDYTINTSNNTYSSGSGSSQSTILLATGFNYQKDYQIAVYYNDALVNTSVILTLTKGQPIINWGSDYFNVNGSIKQNNKIMFAGGSWTPTLDGANVTWSERTGYWRKIGSVVVVTFKLKGTINSLSTSPAYAFISGLPYSAMLQQAGSLFEYANCCNQNYQALLRVVNNQFCLQNDDTAHGSGALQWVAGQGTFYLSGTATYIVE